MKWLCLIVMSIGYNFLQALTASDALLVASSVEHHPHLRELTVKLCSVFLVKGGVEGMTRRHGVEKLVITPFMRRRGECLFMVYSIIYSIDKQFSIIMPPQQITLYTTTLSHK